jgi:apolipoprotein N-acyltransferase
VQIWAAGYVYWLGALHWLRLSHWTAWFGWFLLSFYLAFYAPAFVALSRVAVHRLRVPLILAVPTVWTGLEYARAHFMSGFSMGAIAHTQYRWTTLIQIGDLAGEYGVDFLLLLVAACIARCWGNMRWGGSFPRSWGGSCTATPDSRTNGAAVQLPPQRDSQLPPQQELKPDAQAREVGAVASADHPSLAGASGFKDPSLAGASGFNFARLWPLLPAAAAMAAALIYGYFRTSGDYTTPGKNVLLVQGSIDTELKFDPNLLKEVYRHYFELTDRATATAASARKRVDLIVWPETMFREKLVLWDEGVHKPAGFEGTEEQFQERLQEEAKKARGLIAWTARQFNAPLILGLDAFHLRPAKIECYNSAVYVSPEGRIVGQYDKMHPVVFGERWPLVEYWPWLEEKLMSLGMNLTPGGAPAVFPLNGYKIAPNICYETVLPHLIRRQVRELMARGEEPDVLVNLTNDGWFWGSSELDMHLACDVFRAVECRKPLLVAANTGISAWINGDGRVLARGPKRATDTILAEVQVDARRSPYLAYGDWPAGLCLVACAVFGAVGCRRAFRRTESHSVSSGTE